MVVLVALAVLALAGAMSAVVALARDPRPWPRTEWDYDSRHPQL